MTWEGGAPLQDYRRPENLSLKGPNLQNQHPSSVDQQSRLPKPTTPNTNNQPPKKTMLASYGPPSRGLCLWERKPNS